MKILSREKRASAVIIVKTVYFDCGFWYGTVGASMMIKSCKQFLQKLSCVLRKLTPCKILYKEPRVDNPYE